MSTGPDEKERPVLGRDPLGRHKVDLRQIKSPWLRYGLALTVVGIVIGLAWWAGRDTRSGDEDFAWLVPWLGGAALIVVVLGVIARVFGGRR